MQWYEGCLCGNSYGKHGKADPAECNTPCKHDPNDENMCGGPWRNNIYESITTTIEPETEDVPETVEPTIIKLGTKDYLFDDSFEDSEIGCGFQLVRRVKAGSYWHPTNDGLKGSDEYGDFEDDYLVDKTFTRKWNRDEVTEFLFASGDFSEWMIMSKESVGGSAMADSGYFYDHKYRPIIASSRNNNPYTALMYNRP